MKIPIMIVLSFCISLASVFGQHADSLTRKKVWIRSSIDNSLQPCYVYLPQAVTAGKKQNSVLIFLHTWSTDLEQRFPELEQEIAQRGWILLEPNFRGRNDHPKACGSVFAQQDIIDALNWARQNYFIDAHHVYLAGFSGGGYLTMLMVMLHPQYWTAASAWCGISDLEKWYDYHEDGYYGELMRRCFGGSPSRNKSIGAEYRRRSPASYFSKALKLPLDIEAGRNDTIVPPQQSIDAFNAICSTAGNAGISKTDLADSLKGGESKPADATAGRRIYLRKQAGECRITIFDGGHEWIPAVALKWFDEH